MCYSPKPSYELNLNSLASPVAEIIRGPKNIELHFRSRPTPLVFEGAVGMLLPNLNLIASPVVKICRGAKQLECFPARKPVSDFLAVTTSNRGYTFLGF